MTLSYWGFDYSYHYTPINAEERAADAVRRILRKPTDIIIQRGQTTLDPQTVRIELTAGGEQANEVAEWVTQPIIIFGIRDHAHYPDTDIRVDDRVFYGGMMYEIKTIMELPGQYQCYGERVGG